MSGYFISNVVRRLGTVIQHVSVVPSPKFSHSRTLSNLSSLTEQSTPTKPCIQANPRVALYDDVIDIKLQNFPPNEKVTVHGQVMQLSSKILFASSGHYITSSDGSVHLSQDISHGGTYTGVEPMGILWSLRTAPGQPPHTRMAINFTDKPCQVELKTYLGHVTLEDIYDKTGSHTKLSPVAETQLERWFRGSGVKRYEIDDGNIRGALYLPPGDGPFRGVIDMFGSSGGLIEYRSALLASRGFATLSLAYFKYKDLQKTMYDLKYEYFEEAIEWLCNHPKVCSSGIGVMAVSKGVECALIMGAYSPKVKAVLAINGFCFPTLGNFLRNGEVLLRAGEFSVDGAVQTDEGFDIRTIFQPGPDYIPIWQGNAKYLFFDSQDDFQKDPDANNYCLEYLCPVERRKDIQVVRYAGAGHLLEPPYNPLCRSSVNKGVGMHMLWGGQTRDHAYAQIDAWKRTLKFLNTNIPVS